MTELLILLLTAFTLVVDLGILYYVKRECDESRELNQKLNRVYKAKKKKLNADRLVKEVIKQEAQTL